MPRLFCILALSSTSGPSPRRLLKYPQIHRLFTLREVKARDKARMRRTGGTPQ